MVPSYITTQRVYLWSMTSFFAVVLFLVPTAFAVAQDYDAVIKRLKQAVDAKEISPEQAKRMLATLKISSGKQAPNPKPPVKRPTFIPKKGVNGTDYKINSLEEQKRLQTILPLTSTGDDKEGPVACGFFGWAADATHRFMDNSHKGETREIHGLSFRLDYRDHDTIGRTWDNITVKIAHGNWSSIKYNASRDFELLDDQTAVFSKEWAFPTLRGYPSLKPADHPVGVAAIGALSDLANQACCVWRCWAPKQNVH